MSDCVEQHLVIYILLFAVAATVLQQHFPHVAYKHAFCYYTLNRAYQALIRKTCLFDEISLRKLINF